jgi:hypothetical protein
MGLAWQTIDQQQQITGSEPRLTGVLRTDRAKIPGGWLVRTVAMHRELTEPTGGYPDIEANIAIALTFVPDTSNAWAQP